MKKGEYVCATKYQDGDPRDPFCIGYFREMTHHARFLIEDSSGKLFRANGFRRCQRISERVGAILVKGLKLIEQGSASVWFWRYHPMQLKELIDSW